ncbi:MAG: 16S rRNA (guanine527-N7)-methyltransferase [Candidatus Azotimanducaceae bacterium]|jgi:16S rRNA (guanine527-N7)-methyltransferase
MIAYDLLLKGLGQLDLDSVPDLEARLGAFVADLVKWNKVYNLTAIREIEQIIPQHIFDSLSVHPYINGQTIVDVGTGGGFPGIPLAMIMPDKQFTLLDSNGKKTRFLQQMIINHRLTNCVVVQSRAESYAAQFDVVICRAFAALDEIVVQAGHLVAEGGQLLAMKGQSPDGFASLPGTFTVSEVHKLVVPALNADRHLIALQRTGPSEPT